MLGANSLDRSEESLRIPWEELGARMFKLLNKIGRFLQGSAATNNKIACVIRSLLIPTPECDDAVLY